MSRLRFLLPVLFTLIAAPAFSAHPSNPFEWTLRTNGLGWGEGYHAYNGCCKQGVLPRSSVPGPGYYQHNYYGSMHAGTFGPPPGYYHSPAPHQMLNHP